MKKTTIQISPQTLERLKFLKRHERESYEELLNYLLDECEEDSLDDEEIEEIQEALENVRQEKVKPIEQVARELGVSLN